MSRPKTKAARKEIVPAGHGDLRDETTFVSVRDSIAKAKSIYRNHGLMTFVVKCTEPACTSMGHGLYHLTRRRVECKFNKRLDLANKHLADFYNYFETFQKGKPRREQPSRIRARRKDKLTYTEPFRVWENEGGPLHPNEIREAMEE